MHYLVIKRIHAQRMNCLQTPYLVSPAPIFACAMLGHAVAARLQVKDLGVGIIHHSHEYEIEALGDTNEILRPCYFQGASTEANDTNEDPRKNPIIPTVTGHINLSLIIQLDQAVDNDQCYRLLRKMRFRLAGGIVPDDPIISDTDDLNEAIRQCGRGYWLSDAVATVRERLKEGKGIIEAVMGKIQLPGWHVPAVVGYRALTSFANRKGARDNLPHAFAEALVGLVRYDSIYKILQNKEHLKLWRHQWLDKTTFVVSQEHH